MSESEENAMIDPKRTLELISGGLFNAEKTWQDYLPEADDWQKTALLLTVPLVLLGAVGAYLVSVLGSNSAFFMAVRPTLVSTLAGILMSLVTAGVVAFIFGAIAGAVGGKNHFGLALAATTFAFIPGYISQAVMWLPWIGGLLAFGLFIYGMILLWKILPIYLQVPDDKQTMHYAFSLLAAIVAVAILSLTLGRFLMPSMGSPSYSPVSDTGSPSTSSNSGMFGGIARQGELLAAAEEDRYNPPSNGRLSKAQVREFIRVMERTAELQEEKAANLKALTEKADNNEEMSFRDIGDMLGGAAEITGLPTTEIEVVKTAGGNWAEHQWVRESLRTARIQRDINSDIAHNYELYQDYEEELSGILGL